MKLKSGNISAGISRASSNKPKMEKYGKQKRYWEKQRKINEENAAIVVYVQEKYPWVIRELSEKGKVRVISIKLISKLILPS